MQFTHLNNVSDNFTAEAHFQATPKEVTNFKRKAKTYDIKDYTVTSDGLIVYFDFGFIYDTFPDDCKSFNKLINELVVHIAEASF